MPRALGLCTDESVNGAPFYVMSFVEGHIVRDERAASLLTEAARARCGARSSTPWPKLHAVDIDAVGLGDFARRDGYIARQLKRWHGQFSQSTWTADPARPWSIRSTSCLAARIPEQQGVVIVHGDYRLDNTVLDDHGDVQAILDWEICTLGDPLADLGLLLVYWAEPEDADQALVGVAPTSLPGFARRSELMDRYAERTGLDVSKISYYRAFGFWKLACILQGVYVRYASGAAAGDRSGTRSVRGPRGAARRTGPGRSGVVVTDHDPSSLYEFDPDWGEPVEDRALPPGPGGRAGGLGRRRTGGLGGHRLALASAPVTAVASFDTELLIDQRARRPIARLEDGITTELTWPAIQLVTGKDRVGADMLYLTGPEPDFRWPTFINAVVGLVKDLKVRVVVGLGAFPAPTPHTRPVRLASTVPPQSAELAGRVGTVHGTLEVPAGVQAALEVSLGLAGVPVIGLWARVPTTCRPCPTPKPAPPSSKGCAPSPDRCWTAHRCEPPARPPAARWTS